MSKKNRVLFIGPVFFDYTEIIINEFTSRGFAVHFLNENPIGIWQNIIRRISIPLVRSFVNAILRIRLVLLPNGFDVIFLIHGDLLNKEFLTRLKRKYITANYIMYQWDSVRNNSNTTFLEDYFETVFSFDPEDCRTFGYTYLPNFYKPFNEISIKKGGEEGLLFVGKGHTDRLEVLNKIRAHLDRSVSTNYFIVVPWYKYITYRFYCKYQYLTIEDFRFRKVEYSQLQSLISCCKAVIDIHNPNQDGLTQRPFDTLAHGKVLVTTSKNIVNELFYSEEAVLIIDRENPANVNDVLKKNNSNLSNVENYSLSRWMDMILASI